MVYETFYSLPISRADCFLIFLHFNLTTGSLLLGVRGWGHADMVTKAEAVTLKGRGIHASSLNTFFLGGAILGLINRVPGVL